MIKLKTFILIIIIYLISFISIKLEFNLFYPYYLIKDMLYYPVSAIDDDIELSKEVKEGILIEQEKEFQELKKINNLSNTLTEFESITAMITSRNKMYWFNTITVNKGKNSGVEEDMAVISSDGLIGKVSKVSKKNSEIKLITTSDVNFKISVMIKSDNNTVYGIMNNYNSENNYLEVSLTNKINDVSVGSLVYTTGMGGIFPSGILIGKVSNIEDDKYKVSKIIQVTPSSNFNDFHFVIILKRK